MSFKVGDKILTVSSLDDPTSITERTVTKVGKDTVQCGSSEYTFYSTFCWPARVKDRLTEICTERARLKKIYDDSMRLVYQLANEISRGEV